MIKLIDLLIAQYSMAEKLYLSWDAASWHKSKPLYKRIEELNSEAYRQRNGNPLVEIVPLPTTAQFLNLIESVFSGLARAVLHNSDYASVEECKQAIDLYFLERNKHFKLHPKRAGKYLWGDELVIPVFDELQNCLNPRNKWL
jgi:hypothetical protein